MLPIYDPTEARAARTLGVHLAPHFVVEEYRPAEGVHFDGPSRGFDDAVIRTHCVIVLVSPNLIASAYWALAAARLENLLQQSGRKIPRLVVPLIYKQCDWNQDPLLGMLRPIPLTGIPIHNGRSCSDKAWNNAARELVKAVTNSEKGGLG